MYIIHKVLIVKCVNDVTFLKSCVMIITTKLLTFALRIIFP